MRYEIVMAPDADEALQKLRAYDRIAVLDAIEIHLRHEPTKTSRSRIKALRGLRRPQYRLRIGALRVFYDVGESSVWVLTVLRKSEAAAWLARWGIQLEEKGELP